MKYRFLFALLVVAIATLTEPTWADPQCSDDSECYNGLTCTVNNGPNGVNSGICVDCEGTEEGPLRIDRCEICGGSDECVGCDDIAHSGLEWDACDPPVCGGDGSTCAGCDNVANSGLEWDECGDCGGDNSRCVGCDGIPNSGKEFDSCRKCGGNDDCCRDDYGTICNDHGACDLEISGDTKCACDLGWTGPVCNIEQYYCTDAAGQYAIVDCGTHGTCSEESRGQCICDNDYFGPECNMKKCGAHGVWQPSLSKCVCREGFKGKDCNTCAKPGDLHNVKEIVNRMTKNSNKANMFITAKDTNKEDGAKIEKDMSFVCVSPSIYNQKYYDSLEFIDPNGDNGATMGSIEAKIVNYELFSYPVEKIPMLLKGRDPFSQGFAKDELPVLPNTTRSGVYYDCGCFAWTVETVRSVKPSEEDMPFITARAANTRLSYNHHDHELAQNSHFMHAHIVSRASNASIENNTIANDLLNDCLEALSVEATSESTPEQIGKLIQDGVDGIDWLRFFCSIWFVGTLTVTMFSFLLGVVIFIFFNYTIGFDGGFSLTGTAMSED